MRLGFGLKICELREPYVRVLGQRESRTNMLGQFRKPGGRHNGIRIKIYQSQKVFSESENLNKN